MANDWQNYTDRSGEDRRVRQVRRETWRKGARLQRRAVRAAKEAFLRAGLWD
jgi:hypothetical protein